MKIIKNTIDFNEAIKDHSFAIINTNYDSWRKTLDLLHQNLNYYNFQSKEYCLIIQKTKNYCQCEGGNYYTNERLNSFKEKNNDIICINDVDFLIKYKYPMNKQSIDNGDISL